MSAPQGGGDGQVIWLETMLEVALNPPAVRPPRLGGP